MSSRRSLRSVCVVLGVFALLLLLGQAQAASTITVSTTDDELNSDGDCSLREAIQAANSDSAVDACAAGSGTDTVNVPAGVYALAIAGTGEDANLTGDLDITADLVVDGAGAATTVVDGAGLDRVLHNVGGTVEISGLTVRNGSFVGKGPGIENDNGTLTLTDSVVTGNTAVPGRGGGVDNESGTLTLTNVTVSGNDVGGNGGGVNNFFGTVTVNSSTVSGNTVTTGNGGGIENSAGTLTVNNSTVSGNTLTTGIGGGIDSTGGTLTVNNSTVSGNIVTSGIGGGVTENGSVVTLKSTIVADNGDTAGSKDCSGTITSAGYNLIKSVGTCVIVGDTTGNITGSDPMLGPLRDNGGPTETHALLPGSPAIDAGSPGCPPPATDQRGTSRPQGAACDIGAFESVRFDYVCYAARDVTRPRQNPGVVSLADQFEAADYDLRRAYRFCAPADDDGAGIADPVTHLKRYRIKRVSAGKFSPVTVDVTNQFGTARVEARRPRDLMVPTSKSLDTTPPPPDPGLAGFDYYTCYKVRSKQRVNQTVVVTDQFGLRELLVRRPVVLCVPTSRDGEPINKPERHLLCYRVRRALRPPAVFVNNEFGPEQLKLTWDRALCVQSTKTPVP